MNKEKKETGYYEGYNLSKPSSFYRARTIFKDEGFFHIGKKGINLGSEQNRLWSV